MARRILKVEGQRADIISVRTTERAAARKSPERRKARRIEGARVARHLCPKSGWKMPKNHAPYARGIGDKSLRSVRRFQQAPSTISADRKGKRLSHETL